jgi:hypothetical protein
MKPISISAFGEPVPLKENGSFCISMVFSKKPIPLGRKIEIIGSFSI